MVYVDDRAALQPLEERRHIATHLREETHALRRFLRKRLALHEDLTLHQSGPRTRRRALWPFVHAAVLVDASVIDPKNNRRITAKAYWQWQKALLRSGDREVFLASNAALLVTTYGTWGHNCRPSADPTLSRDCGMSTDALGDRMSLLVKRGWLWSKKRSHLPTIYCIAAVADDKPSPPAAGPCRECFPDEQSIRSGADRQAAPEPDDQESLPRDSAAARARPEPGPVGTSQPPVPAVLTSSQHDRVWALAEVLHELRPDITEHELLIFAQVTGGHLELLTQEELDAATRALATAHVITANSVGAFMRKQKPLRRRPARNAAAPSTKLEQLVQLQEQQRPMLEAALAWERQRDDEQSASWTGQLIRCDPTFLLSVLEEWRAAGRGGS